jgi:hypothetical protein
MEMVGDFERHVMPNGSVVYYRDSDHSYYGEIQCKSVKAQAYSGVAATRLPSPSTIAKYADTDKDKLMDWVARMTKEGKDWRQQRAIKGGIGELAHARFAALLLGQEVTPLTDLPEKDRAYCEAVDRFFNELSESGEWKLLQQEAVVYSAKHKYAGRFDARLLIGEEVWLLDGKVSGYIGKSYHNQLAGYDLAAEESGYGHTDHIGILQWLENGHYRVWPCHGTREGFLLNLGTYRDGKRLDKLMNADYKEFQDGP